MKKVRLFLQIPPNRAEQVVGWLWANGTLSRTQYERNMRLINAKRLDTEIAKRKKTEKQFAQIRQFYTKQVKNCGCATQQNTSRRANRCE